MDKSLTTFKLQIYKYTLLSAAVLAVGALPALGVGVRYVDYLYGLLLGTCISVMSFSILLIVSSKVIKSGEKKWAPIGYIARLPLYGFAFYMCIKISIVCGVACLLGFFTSTLSIIFVHGIKPGRPKVKKEINCHENDKDD